MKNIEEIPRDRRAGFRVPDGYFAQLNERVVTAATTEKPTRWATFRSLTAFAASFAAMVMIAVTGYYFTGHKALNSEIEQDNLYLVSLYDIQLDEILAANEADELSSELFAEAAYNYLDLHGYDLTSEE